MLRSLKYMYLTFFPTLTNSAEEHILKLGEFNKLA